MKQFVARLTNRPFAPSSKPRAGRGERVYAVGDVHGRFDLLLQLLIAIECDDKQRAPRKKKLIFLGDLIDRGPESARVVSWLHQVQRTSKRLVVLMGNHEAALLDSMEGDGRSQEMWLEHGGSTTLACYGIAPPQPGESPESFAERLQQGIPADLADWLRDLPLTSSSGSYFFCHAGVRPGIRLSRQTAQDLLGIRSSFLESDCDHGAVIVHGHSICGEKVEFSHNRINVDTGAFSSGVLSAVGLQDTEQWVISTAASN